jgi:hypothetical protein
VPKLESTYLLIVLRHMLRDHLLVQRFHKVHELPLYAVPKQALFYIRVYPLKQHRVPSCCGGVNRAVSVVVQAKDVRAVSNQVRQSV